MLEYPPEQQLSIAQEAIQEIEKKRIKLEDFRGHKYFTDQEIDEDIRKCAEMESRFDERSQQSRPESGKENSETVEKGKIAESVFLKGLERNWLAPAGTMETIITSQYDDFFRGIDSVAQIILGPGSFDHLGLSLDFTIGDSQSNEAVNERIGKKIRSTFDSLDQGFTPAVKYFKSEKTGIVKNLKMPRMVVAASRENISRLASYYNDMHSSQGKASAEEALENDPFQYVLFGEIMAQLDVFSSRLKAVVEKAETSGDRVLAGRARESLATHQKARDLINQLATQKNVTLEKIQKHIRGDSAAAQMAVALSALNRTPINFK